MSGVTVKNRMADVVFALGEAKRASVHPTKIQLQKFVYLADTLAQVVGSLKPVEGHKTYRNGPYDLAIQNAVDSLTFRGIVRVAGVWRTPSGHLGTSYALTSSGEKFLKRLQEAEPFSRKSYVAGLIGVELRRFGWSRIVALVYAEPTFVATRPRGWGEQLNVEDGLHVSAAFVLAVVRRVERAIRSEQHEEDRGKWLVNRFFAYLNDYDRNHGEAPPKPAVNNATIP